MPGHLVKARYNETFKKSLCFPSGNFVYQKTGEIWLCVDYHKLNSIVVRDFFPLPQIDEALQTVHKCQ